MYVDVLPSPDPSDFDGFGSVLDVTDEFFIIGAPFQDRGPSLDEVGAAYLYDRAAFGQPTQKEKPFVPLDFNLEPNYPNPFRVQTTIRFHHSEAADIKLTIYSLLGRVVRTFSVGYQPAGQHVTAWDGRDDEGRNVPSGLYVAVLESGSSKLSQKILVVR